MLVKGNASVCKNLGSMVQAMSNTYLLSARLVRVSVAAACRVAMGRCSTTLFQLTAFAYTQQVCGLMKGLMTAKKGRILVEAHQASTVARPFVISHHQFARYAHINGTANTKTPSLEVRMQRSTQA